MSPQFLSTGIPGLDSLLEGLWFGDNLLFHVEDDALYRRFVTAVLRYCHTKSLRIAYLRFDPLLDNLIPPSTHWFDGTRFHDAAGCISDPSAFTHAVSAFITAQDQPTYFLASDLTLLGAALGGEDILLSFYCTICRLLAARQTIAYWMVRKGRLSESTMTLLCETAQICLELEGRSTQPIICIRKALGRYSERMAWPHILNWTTGTLLPLHGQGPATADLITQVQDKLEELKCLRNRHQRALEESQVLADIGHHVLSGMALPTLFDKTVQQLAWLLETEYVQILEHLPHQARWRLLAGTGWLPALFTKDFSDEDLPDVQITDSAPLVAQNIPADSRFARCRWLLDYPIASGVLVAIPGTPQPFGLLGVYTATPRTFCQEELQFLTILSQWLGMAAEHHQTLVELERSREHFHRIIELSEDAIISIDQQQRIVLFNQAAKAIFGYQMEEIIGRSLDQLIPNRLREVHREHVHAFLQTEEQTRPTTMRSRIVGLRKHGEEFPAEASLIKFEMGGEPILTARLRDLTEELRREETLRETEAQLRHTQKMEAVGRLAGGVAHDFNNILTAISGYAELLHQLPLSGSFTRYVEEIQKAAQRATKLTRQLLAFGRRQHLQAQVIDLNSILTDMEPMIRRLISEDIAIVCQLAPDIGSVKVDPNQLEQVILNLVVNAKDAMPHGGTLTLETANVQPEELTTVQAVNPDLHAAVVLRVKDTGIGMSDELQAHIFEPFFTTKPQGEGTGLGLSTVEGIVRQSGGTILVSSQPGHGATFSIYLPRVEAMEAEQPASAPSFSRPSSGSETILLVEDEDQVRRLACEILETAGYRIVAASTVEQALAFCDSHRDPVALLITDVVMPRMSGSELYHRLRALYPNLKVLLMSGYVDESLRQKGLLDERLPFLPKPFTPAELTNKVREVLDSP
ncbi:MAG: hybrid sensor histidine kinase/response regulator [Nitrospirae bacterium]|nr:MAG: hybrid sensor histidine kinase/response regulator [Nitrospirota bacterium]